MDCIATQISYRETNSFAPIVLDYLDRSNAIREFCTQFPSVDSVSDAVRQRKFSMADRKTLVSVLQKQYKQESATEKVNENIKKLSGENSFAIVTAHQPNILTGPLYFIYKIIHVIRIADHLNEQLPSHRFVPVFYMGSEDADLDELGNVSVDGKKYEWNTEQTGAVGRMKVDKKLADLISAISGQISVLPSGGELSRLIQSCFKEGSTIQQATFSFLHQLFGKFGLVILIPDDSELKKMGSDIFRDEILNQNSSVIVGESIRRLQNAGYKTQANPREINLFYLKDGMRERIVQSRDKYKINGTELGFTRDEMLAELKNHPERFSPNVILRAVYQERILPGVCFVGGGGELAYWLQYKDLFRHFDLSLPVLVLRNSFLVVEKKWNDKFSRLGFEIKDLFRENHDLISSTVARLSSNKVKLNGAFEEVSEFYDKLKHQSGAIDQSLATHIESLKARTIHRLEELEKKMLRAEKRKFSDQERQIRTIKEKLFPKGGLQERMESMIYYYSLWGGRFLDALYQHSPTFEQQFTILSDC